MDLRAADGVALRFHAYIEHLSKALGHADRHAPLGEYCTGLLLPGERKSVEPMAARMAPVEVGAKHQSLHHFVAKAPGTRQSCSLRCARSCCRSWRRSRRSVPGSSTTPAFRRRASTRSASRDSTAASSANRTTVRWR